MAKQLKQEYKIEGPRLKCRFNYIFANYFFVFVSELVIISMWEKIFEDFCFIEILHTSAEEKLSI